MKQFEIDVAKKQALIHLGSLDSFDITEGGKNAARCILDYLDSGEIDHLRRAVQIYEELIPNENFGGEYTALEWLCNFWQAPQEQQERLLSYAPVQGFYELLSKDDFYYLKWYIDRKYHFVEIDRKDLESKDQLRFLEDFILFGNPDRERWEKVRENIQKLPLYEGIRIADVGSGPGYYSFKFADLVGESGKVYAIETNPRHLEYLRWYIEKNHVTNVEAVTSSFEGIGLPPETRVDMVYICSLYHNVYAAFTDEERDSFVGSIRRALRPQGKLVIVDNDLVQDDELPYHGPYIARELLLSQLYYYGFELQEQYQFTPQRYVLILEKKEEIPESSLEKHAAFTDDSHSCLRVSSTSSLVRYRIIGTTTSGYTWNGKRLALQLVEGLEKGDKELLGRTAEEYKALMKKERIGDEYTALLWFIQVYLASDREREEALSDPLESDYYDFFAGNDFSVLKAYLKSKYEFKVPLPEKEVYGTLEVGESEIPRGQLNEWSEYLTFNNPNRYLWEDTRTMLRYLDIREGETVADIGCGSGYFTWQFAKAVGSAGTVYATEINPDALSYVERFSEKCGGIIVPRVGQLNDVCLEENSVDTMFLCSMYHATYIASIEFVRRDFIESMKKSIRSGGRLYIVDNDITSRGEPAYFGPGITKELVIAQLCQYGFELEEIRQFVPQRYVLRFRNAKEEGGKSCS